MFYLCADVLMRKTVRRWRWAGGIREGGRGAKPTYV